MSDLHGLSREKVFSVEVYGFVLWIGSIVTWLVYTAFAFIPSETLEYYGITHYPNRYWCLAIPAWVTMFIIYAFFAYMFINMKCTHDLGSIYSLVDSFNLPRRAQDVEDVNNLINLSNDDRSVRERDVYYLSHVDNRPIPEAFDIPPNVISTSMFG